MKTIIAGLAALSIVHSVPTQALASDGVFDALDPCIKQTKMFRDAKDAAISEINSDISQADTANPTTKYRDDWFVSKRIDLRSRFNEFVLPSLTEAGVQDENVINKMYDGWFNRMISTIGAENINRLISDSYRQELKRYRIEKGALTEREIENQKHELEKACKNDAGSQILRGTVTAVMAPIGLASRNLEIAKRESGFLAKLLAVPTGISVDAINKNGGVFGGGLSGGPNSFFRKNLGIRF